MASAYTQIYEYKDPIQLDISSTLGKAATYKQGLYDTNSSQIQQLVNQYVGTDLLRDVDQKYLGDRLKTLTNYINQSGAMDWSRRSVFDDVSSYVGQALDANVMAGVASTQRFRKHQLQMDDLRKNKPELYSVQNDWMATRDFDRYMSSGQLGDMYKQGSYVPFEDVNKLIKDGLPMLKEHGVEVEYTSDGNPLLMRIGKHDVLTEQKTSNFLNLILGEKGNTQLSIDGLYKYRNKSEEDVKTEYKGTIQNQIQQLNEQSRNFRVLQAGKTDAEKAVYQKKAEEYQSQANKLVDFSKNIDNLDKDSITSNMYVGEFKQKWSKLLAFDRVTDWKIDDRNFQIAKRNDDLVHKQWEREFNEDKFVAEQNWKQKDYNLEMAKAMGDGKVSLDADGNPIPVSASTSSSGITTTSNGTALDEPKTVLAEDVQANYSQAWIDARDSTTSYINELRKTESGKNILREHYGNLADGDAVKLAYAMMRGTKDSQIRLSALRDVMNKSETGRSALGAIDNAIVAHRQKEKMKPLLDDALKGITDITKTVMKADNIGGEFYGLSGKIINRDGKLTDGTYIGQDFDNLNSQQKLGAQIGSITNRLFAGKISEAERSALVVLRTNLVSQLKDKATRDWYNGLGNNENKGFWDSATSQLSAAGQKFRRLWNLNMMAIGFVTKGKSDDEDIEAYSDATQTMKANQANARKFWNNAGNHIGDMFNTNYTFNDLASNDLTRKGSTLSMGKSKNNFNQSAHEAYTQKVAPSLKILNDKLQDNNAFKLANKTINLNTEDKNVKSNYESWIKAQFDGEVQGNSNVKINVNSTDGTVTVTAPVKDGKTFENTTTAPIAFADLPEKLKAQLGNNNSYEYDAGSNPNPGTIYARGQVYQSDDRINALYGDLEINPTEKRASIETVQKNVQNVIGQTNFEKYKKEIDEIIRTPVDMEAHPVNGVYVMDIKSGNKVISRQVMGTNIADQKYLIAEQKDKIAVEKIMEYIKKNYNK